MLGVAQLVMNLREREVAFGRANYPALEPDDAQTRRHQLGGDDAPGPSYANDDGIDRLGGIRRHRPLVADPGRLDVEGSVGIAVDDIDVVAIDTGKSHQLPAELLAVSAIDWVAEQPLHDVRSE